MMSKGCPGSDSYLGCPLGQQEAEGNFIVSRGGIHGDWAKVGRAKIILGGAFDDIKLMQVEFNGGFYLNM